MLYGYDYEPVHHGRIIYSRAVHEEHLSSYNYFVILILSININMITSTDIMIYNRGMPK